MDNSRPSVSQAPLAFALVALLLAATPAVTALPQIKSVGEIFIDAQGRASGQNLAGRIAEASGEIDAFRAVGLRTTIFDRVSIDGFAAQEKISGVGSSSITLRGTNAVVSLHDNVHSLLRITTTSPTTVRYTLSAGLTATQEGAGGGLVRVSQGGALVGHIVAVGSEGPRTRGEALVVKGNEITARGQSGSELLFLAKPASIDVASYQETIVQALAEGALASHYITEFEGSSVATSQVDSSEGTLVRTTSDASGTVQSAIAARPKGPTLLVYDLAYETLAARSADDVAVYVDGELAERVGDARDVLARADSGLASYAATSQGGRTQVVASTPQGGDHRVVVSVSAQASTERQGRAEQDGDDDARVYGGFEYHANGKLTGEFLTSVLPEGRAQLLSFTSLATRTEVFRNVSIDGAAAASLHASGEDGMRVSTPKADLTLVDDVFATMLLRARMPVDATYALAAGVTARALGDDILLLEGPHGPAGALVLVGEGSLRSGETIRAALEAGDTLVYRGAPDAHDSEPALLRALAEGGLGAQVLVGIQDGQTVAHETTYSQEAEARVVSASRGAVALVYQGDTPFALDARGAALLARAAEDLRITVDGALALEAPSAEDALQVGGEARYHAATTVDGALRIIVNTAGSTGRQVDVRIESRVAQDAQERSRTDAFGAFRLYGDGSAVGEFVTLKADKTAGAVSGFVATGEPLFASLVAGNSPYIGLEGDGQSVLRLTNRESVLEVSDSTNGFTKLIALQATDAAFRLAADLHAESSSQGVVDILAQDGRHVGSLVVARAATLEQRGDQEIRAHLAQGGELAFRTHAGIESELSDAQRRMVNEAIAAGRVGGHLVLQSEQHVVATVEATYGDLELATQATQERVDITASSVTHAGRTILVSLDPQTIPGMAQGQATIRFDGALAAQASSYADILDATDDAGAAEYFVLAGDAGTQVLVSIPGFSVHTVTLEQKEPASRSWYLYATIFLGLLVIVESVLLARNARKNKLNASERRP